MYALEVNGTSTYGLGKAGVAVILLKRIKFCFLKKSSIQWQRKATRRNNNILLINPKLAQNDLPIIKSIRLCDSAYGMMNCKGKITMV